MQDNKVDDDMHELEQDMASMQPPSSEAQADDRNASPIMRKTSVDLGLWNYVYDQSMKGYKGHFPGDRSFVKLDLKEILDRGKRDGYPKGVAFFCYWLNTAATKGLGYKQKQAPTGGYLEWFEQYKKQEDLGLEYDYDYLDAA